MYLSREVEHTATLNSFGPGNGGSPVYSALLFPPTKSVYNEDGSYSLPGGGYGPVTNYNPVALAEEPIKDGKTNISFINMDIGYKILEGLKFSSRGGYRLRDGEYGEFLNSKPTAGLELNSSHIWNGRTLFLQNTNMLTYNKKLKGGHDLVLTTVYEQQYEEYNESRTSSSDFLTNVSYDNLQIGANPSVPTSSRTKKSLSSYFARANYGYKGKYISTFTVRADGSSVFGADHKWGYFPSAALAWNLTNEDFFKDNNTVTNLKLRTSYGIVGNQGISPYQSLSRLNTGFSYPIDGSTLSPGVSLDAVANPDLRWEQTSQLNIGIDLKLLKGKIDLVVDFYQKETKDLLQNIPLPKAGGGSGMLLKNVGEVENKGMEVYLNFKPIDKSNFTWESSFTFTKNINKVVALSGGESEIPLGGANDAVLPGFDGLQWLEVGQPIGLMRGYQYDGVWTTVDRAEAAIVKQSGKTFFPGAPKFVDQDGNNIINDKDIVNIGNAQPDFTYGWNNTVSYKNIDLTIFIQGVYGNDLYNIGRVVREFSGINSNPTSTTILNRWTPNNENTNVPSFRGTSAFGTVTSSRWMEDGSYLRVKNISLAYSLSDNIAERLHINSARLYVAATNLFTITNYTGFDPESSTRVDSYGGIDLATYPSQKIVTLGLDLKF